MTIIASNEAMIKTVQTKVIMTVKLLGMAERFFQVAMIRKILSKRTSINIDKKPERSFTIVNNLNAPPFSFVLEGISRTT